MSDNSVRITLAKCAVAFDNNGVSWLVYESLLRAQLPDQGLCPLNPTGGSARRPHYRLTLQRSPYSIAPPPLQSYFHIGQKLQTTVCVFMSNTEYVEWV